VASSSNSSKDTAATAAAELKPKPSRPKLQDPLIWIDLEMTGVHVAVFCLHAAVLAVSCGSIMEAIVQLCILQPSLSCTPRHVLPMHLPGHEGRYLNSLYLLYMQA
jgi:hypothetical protein